jgi:hypothetical protein
VFLARRPAASTLPFQKLPSTRPAVAIKIRRFYTRGSILTFPNGQIAVVHVPVAIEIPHDDFPRTDVRPRLLN